MQERRSNTLLAANPLAQDPGLAVTAVASLTNLELNDLPTSMQRVIQST